MRNRSDDISHYENFFTELRVAPFWLGIGPMRLSGSLTTTSASGCQIQEYCNINQNSEDQLEIPHFENRLVNGG